jgi:hypothetical protein
MHNCVLYRQTRRKYSMLLSMERNFLCVCMQKTSALAKDSKFNVSFAAVPAVLKFAELKWCLPLIRAIKCLLSPSWFTTLNIMSEPLSKNLTNAALKHWRLRPVRVDQQNLLKTTRLLLPKQPSALQTFWIAHLSVGLWKNFGSILLRKRLYRLSVLKRFALFCMRKKSNFDESKHGKNATIQSLSLKKTDSQICKQTCFKWPNNILRRVRSTGNSPSARTNLLSYRPSEKASCNIYSPSRCSALDGFLRCTQEKVVGLCSASQASSGISRSVKVIKEEVSESSENSSDIGQLLATSQSKGIAILPKEQYTFDLDTNQCIMAQSYRMSIYSCKGICYSWNQLPKP